jgi:hypothetical protein
MINIDINFDTIMPAIHSYSPVIDFISSSILLTNLC